MRTLDTLSNEPQQMVNPALKTPAMKLKQTVEGPDDATISVSTPPQLSPFTAAYLGLGMPAPRKR